jgi:hypothetical protein
MSEIDTFPLQSSILLYLMIFSINKSMQDSYFGLFLHLLRDKTDIIYDMSNVTHL